MNSLSGISFIVPCYREESSIILKTVNDIQAVVGHDRQYEIILVNDGGGVGAFPQPPGDNIKIVHHEKNRGYGTSLMSGIIISQYEWMGIIDADGTYPASYFSQFFDKMNDYDMVVGKRSLADVDLLRRLPKYLLQKLASFVSDSEILDLNSGMRLFKKEIALNYRRLFPKRFSFTTTLSMICVNNFFKVCYIKIPYYKRTGQSAIQPIRDTLKFFSLIFRLALYFRPLRFFLPLSAIFLIMAAARGLRDVLAQNYIGGLCMVLFFMAFQTMFFGLIAEIISKKE